MTLSEFIYTVLLKPPILRNTANWLLKKITPTTKNIANAIVYLNPHDPVVSGALTLGVFERDEICFFKRYFRSDMTFVDVGANVGLYSAIALSTEGFRGKILCIEPHGESREYLEKTLSHNRFKCPDLNIVISGKAASNNEGKGFLYQNSSNKGDNRLYSDSTLGQREEVEVSRIDKICMDSGIESINFIKIDVQGAEQKVIEGAKNVINNSKNCIILSELWPYGLSKCGATVGSYTSMLQGLGFSLYELKKKGIVSKLNVDEITSNFQGRKYTNIVGVKGCYLSEIEKN